MEVLPRFLQKNSVVGVGEIGLDDMTAKEERYFEAQLSLAMEHNLPVLVHTPHRNKKQGFLRSLEVVQASGLALERCILDHGNEETIRLTRECGAWLGFSIYPHTKMSPDRMVTIVKEFGVDRIIINSACDWGISDPLAVPKTAKLLLDSGIPSDQVDQLVWRNPASFFAQAGRGTEAEWDASVIIDQRQTFDGNSILRGQNAKAPAEN
jgi:predicted metal-dependent TIM-barrel fold hydrolase